MILHGDRILKVKFRSIFLGANVRQQLGFVLVHAFGEGGHVGFAETDKLVQLIENRTVEGGTEHVQILANFHKVVVHLEYDCESIRTSGGRIFEQHDFDVFVLGKKRRVRGRTLTYRFRF